jgi:hypothetical protein
VDDRKSRATDGVLEDFRSSERLARQSELNRRDGHGVARLRDQAARRDLPSRRRRAIGSPTTRATRLATTAPVPDRALNSVLRLAPSVHCVPDRESRRLDWTIWTPLTTWTFSKLISLTDRARGGSCRRLWQLGCRHSRARRRRGGGGRPRSLGRPARPSGDGTLSSGESQEHRPARWGSSQHGRPGRTFDRANVRDAAPRSHLPCRHACSPRKRKHGQRRGGVYLLL